MAGRSGNVGATGFFLAALGALGNFPDAILAVPLGNFLDGIFFLDLGNFLDEIFFLAVENFFDGIFFAMWWPPGRLFGTRADPVTMSPKLRDGQRRHSIGFLLPNRVILAGLRLAVAESFDDLDLFACPLADKLRGEHAKGIAVALRVSEDGPGAVEPSPFVVVVDDADEILDGSSPVGDERQ